MYELKDYNFHLPEEFIAQKPAEPRDSSRLMVLNQEIEHRKFHEIIEYLQKGDLLILNDTKVIKARIFGNKSTGGKIEALVLNKNEDSYTCLIKGKNIKIGTKLCFENITGKVLEKDEGKCEIRFDGNVEKIMDEYGKIPFPPYFKGEAKDERYQTVFAEKEGAVAAPTAGLHFTQKLLNEIQKKGVNITHLTLHVGYGTFKPVKSEDIREHRIEEEYFTINKKTTEIINQTKENDKKIFGVGTTVMRSLESANYEKGKILPTTAISDIFIYPGYEFKSGVDALITNFHIPKSTLIMLVSAFTGYKKIKNAYEIAIKEKYRFFSFGDAMLLYNSMNSFPDKL